MMKTILLLFCTIILISSCEKPSFCGEADVNTIYNVSDADKSKIPYTGFDTLVFKSDAGDTATLYGQSKKDFYTQYRQNDGDINCQKWHNYNYENFEYYYSSLDTFISQYIFTPFMYGYGNGYGNNPSSSSLKIVINGILYYDGDFTSINNNSNYKDSTLINGKYYNGIYIGNSKNILYNFKYGVLKFKDSNNITWTKLK